MKRVTAIIVMLLLMLTASVSVGGTAFDESDILTVCNSSGLYRVAVNGKTLQIERELPTSFYDEWELRYPIASVNVFGDKVVALCNDFTNEKLVVCVYDTRTGSPDSFAIPHYTYAYQSDYYCDGNELLIQDDEIPSIIYRYSVSGRLIDSHEWSGASVRLLSGYDGELYILCGGKLYRYQNGSYLQLNGSGISAPARFVSKDVLTDCSGTLYRIDGDTLREVLRTGTSGFCPAALIGDTLYYAEGDCIYRYDRIDEIRTDYYPAEMDVSCLYSCGGVLYGIPDNDLTTTVPIPTDAFLPCSAELPPVSAALTSDLYRVDPVNQRITRIPSPTTFAQFKKHLTFSGLTASLYRGEKQVQSGNVGTAMTLKLSGEDSWYYELSVIGDITGEGNVNSRDVGELMDYFLGNIRFDGVYTDAADLSDDGRVDMLDLALLCRMTQ